MAQQKDSCCSLKSGSLIFSVDISLGRVVSFSWNEDEFLLDSNRESVYYGATLWPAPQQYWWPVDEALDGQPYRLVSKSGTQFHIQSLPGKSGLQFEKIFTLQPDTSIHILYRIRNGGKTEKKVGAWELIRTPYGTTFFPGTTAQELTQSNLQHVRHHDGVMWYDFNPMEIQTAQKLFTGAAQGWIAHRKDNLLFIKSYPDLLEGQIAPGHGEVELFVNESATYVELETHGEYVGLQLNDSISYAVVWYLRNFPSALDGDQQKYKWPDYVRSFLNNKVVKDKLDK